VVEVEKDMTKCGIANSRARRSVRVFSLSLFPSFSSLFVDSRCHYHLQQISCLLFDQVVKQLHYQFVRLSLSRLPFPSTNHLSPLSRSNLFFSFQQLNEQAIDDFILSVNLSEWSKLSQNHGVRLPLKFDSPRQELNLLA